MTHLRAPYLRAFGCLAGLCLVGCNAVSKTPQPTLAPPPARTLPQVHRTSNTPSVLTLREASSQRPTDLRHRNNQALELDLRLPEGDSWSGARIGRAVLRQPDGSQISLASPSTLAALRNKGGEDALTLPALQPGTSMIILSAGTGAGERGRDDMAGNHRFAKIIVQQARRDGTIPPAQAGVMQKTGQPLEIRPVRLPMALKVGEEMAFKLYEHQSHRGGAQVQVHHPDAQIQTLTTGPNGMAYFNVRAPGIHHLRYESTVGDQPASAELTFTIPEEIRREP